MSFESNPFLPSEKRPQRRGGLEMRREKPRESAPGLERLHQLPDLHDHLVAIGHPEACAGIYTCDPWKYEPILLDELIKERAGDNDPQRLAEIRGLIRVGSSMTSPRTEVADVKTDLHVISLREEREERARIRLLRPDPDTKKELEENLKSKTEELRRVDVALSSGTVGEELEEAVRTIEELNHTAWLNLKMQMKSDGLDIETAKQHPTARHYVEELEQLRQLRNFLYHRRLYPKWAKLGGVLPVRP